VKVTLDSDSLPDAAGETAYCFGKDMTNSEAPSGAYCYIIETKENSGVFSTVGADLPELIFITSENFGSSSSIVSSSITGTKYDPYDSASTLAEDDTGVFVSEATF
jgi:hypothetical protein